MEITIVVSVCSREKKQGGVPIPAEDLYLGSHINIARNAARKLSFPFFILSGLHGLIKAEQSVMPYDYLLDNIGMARLVVRISHQLIRSNPKIDKILFYTKKKQAWLPYLEALQRAAGRCCISVEVVDLPDNA